MKTFFRNFGLAVLVLLMLLLAISGCRLPGGEDPIVIGENTPGAHGEAGANPLPTFTATPTPYLNSLGHPVGEPASAAHP